MIRPADVPFLAVYAICLCIRRLMRNLGGFR
jgi:hypothetical protein